MEKACYINNIFINAINNNVVMFIKREFAVSFRTKVTILTKGEAGSIFFQGIVDVENIVQNISSGFRIFQYFSYICDGLFDLLLCLLSDQKVYRPYFFLNSASASLAGATLPSAIWASAVSSSR